MAEDDHVCKKYDWFDLNYYGSGFIASYNMMAKSISKVFICPQFFVGFYSLAFLATWCAWLLVFSYRIRCHRYKFVAPEKAIGNSFGNSFEATCFCIPLGNEVPIMISLHPTYNMMAGSINYNILSILQHSLSDHIYSKK